MATQALICEETLEVVDDVEPTWSGGLGNVWVRNGEAVKASHCDDKVGLQTDFVVELAALRSVQGHCNVIELLGVDWTWTPQPALRLALMVGPLSERAGAGAELALKWHEELMCAVRFCHSRGVVHRDIKPHNILLDINDVAVLADFGGAAFVRTCDPFEFSVHDVTTYEYAAPEMLKRESYGASVDMWSVGLVTAEMYNGRRWFTGGKAKTVLRQHSDLLYTYKKRLPKNDHRWEEVRLCLSTDPLKRPWTPVRPSFYSVDGVAPRMSIMDRCQELDMSECRDLACFVDARLQDVDIPLDVRRDALISLTSKLSDDMGVPEHLVCTTTEAYVQAEATLLREIMSDRFPEFCPPADKSE